MLGFDMQLCSVGAGPMETAPCAVMEYGCFPDGNCKQDATKIYKGS